MNKGRGYVVVYHSKKRQVYCENKDDIHCFNTHSHIHDKLVFIAGATLLHCFNLHYLFIFPINEQKGKIFRTIVPSHRMLSLYSQYTCLFFDQYTTT